MLLLRYLCIKHAITWRSQWELYPRISAELLWAWNILVNGFDGMEIFSCHVFDSRVYEEKCWHFGIVNLRFLSTSERLLWNRHYVGFQLEGNFVLWGGSRVSFSQQEIYLLSLQNFIFLPSLLRLCIAGSGV